MEEIKEKYLNYLENQRNFSSFTINSYLEDLKIFDNFLNKEGFSYNEVDLPLIRNFISSELKNNIGKRTIKRRISSLKLFFTFLKNSQVIHSNPFLLLDSLKTPKTYPDILFIEQIDDLIKLSKERKDPLASRDLAIISLLFYSGLRATELVSLNISDFDFSNRIVRVFGKGRKERLVPFSSDCLKALLEYKNSLRMSLVLLKKEYSSFFLNSKGTRLTSRGLEYILHSIEKKTGLYIGLHPHLLRHTFATQLLENGADLRVIQELLGHKSLNATQIYTHVSSKKMQETFIASHPRALKK